MCGVNGEVGWAPPSYIKKCSEMMENEESEESEEEFVADMKGKFCVCLKDINNIERTIKHKQLLVLC